MPEAASEELRPRSTRRPQRPMEMDCGAPPRHAIVVRANGRALRRAPRPPGLCSQPMGVVDVALPGGGAGGQGAGSWDPARAGPTSHVGVPGQRGFGSSPARPIDNGGSGRPARPGVATGLLLPVACPHHSALGPAGGVAARTLPGRGEGDGRSRLRGR